jgi:hypothetical protein
MDLIWTGIRSLLTSGWYSVGIGWISVGIRLVSVGFGWHRLTPGGYWLAPVGTGWHWFSGSSPVEWGHIDSFDVHPWLLLASYVVLSLFVRTF